MKWKTYCELDETSVPLLNAILTWVPDEYQIIFARIYI